MKVIPAATFTTEDIKDLLKIADPNLPFGWKTPTGIEIRVKKAGSISHLFYFDKDRAIGVASVQKEALTTLQPAAHGVRIFQVGLLEAYRGFGLLYRTMNEICTRYRIFASPQMTKAGQHMWLERIRLDKKHIYLAYSPNGFYNRKDQLVQFVPLHKGNVDERSPKVWDGSLQTRLIMVRPSDVLIKRYNVDIKND